MRWRGCPYCGSIHVRRHRQRQQRHDAMPHVKAGVWWRKHYRRCEHCGYVMEPYQKLILWHLVGEYQGGGQPQFQERVHEQKRKLKEPETDPLFDVRWAESSE